MNGERLVLEHEGVYLFQDGFSSASVAPVIKWILDANINRKVKKLDHLTLIINSPGGSCSACFALIDIMNGSKIPVRTVGLGMIASCGFLTFISGQKGHRILTPNTSIMSHQYAWGSGGKYHELVADRKEQDEMDRRMLKIYKRCTGLSEKKIKEILLPESDVWLTATEAKKLGVCDGIKNV